MGQHARLDVDHVTNSLDAAPQPAKGANMTRITIPNMTPEHHAAEISLQLAMIRIAAAERETRIWRIVAMSTTCVAILGVIAVTI